MRGGGHERTNEMREGPDEPRMNLWMGMGEGGGPVSMTVDGLMR